MGKIKSGCECESECEENDRAMWPHSLSHSLCHL